MEMQPEIKRLFELALRARKNAHAPISDYKVGAAVLTQNGTCYSGCNVESVTFNNSTHAEMNAIDTAVAAGEKVIHKILVLTDAKEPIYPCALCRQKIIEFGPDAEIIAANTKGLFRATSISELYPEAFTLKDLGK